MKYPAPLDEIIRLFRPLPERERREMLIGFAESVGKYNPDPEERYDLVEVRQDKECSDEVGVHLKVEEGCVRLRVRLGPKVQTLTRAMASILCQGFDGVRCVEVIETPKDFVPIVIGNELFRQRSQTVYYILDRIKEAVSAYEHSRSG